MSDRYLTIVYKYVSPERTAELTAHPDVSAMAHSHKMDEVNSLREKCEEMQQKLALTEHHYGVMEASAKTLALKADELQRQLDEAAKQKPEIYVAAIHIRAAQENGECKTVIYGDDEHVHHVAPLYRHPPNLPALIEQARAEEREECAKLADAHFIPGHVVAGPQFAAQLSAAIRARSGK